MEAILPPVWRKYWVILVNRTQEDMAYRVNYVVGAFFRFLPLVTSIYLWQAVFAGGPGRNGKIAGMTYGDTIAYYFLVFISRGFSSMPGMTQDISLDIKDGLLNRYLVQPLDYFWYQASYRLAHKTVFWVVALVTFPPVFWLIRDCFTHTPTALEWAAFAFSLILSFAIGLCFSFLVGCLGFWFLEISTFLFVIMTVEFFLSGHLVPLNFLPGWMYTVASFLPFAYEAYWPCAILLGKVPPGSMGSVLGWGCVWALVFFWMCRVLWRAGLRRYAAVGG
jgi:ABC-2 type transport system permease protein